MKKRSPKGYYETVPLIRDSKEFFEFINFRDINLWPIFTNEVYRIYCKKPHKSYMGILKSIIISLFFPEKKLPKKDFQNKILATYFKPRSDHRNFVMAALADFKKNELCLIDPFKDNAGSYLHAFKFSFPSIKKIIRIVKYFNKSGLIKHYKKYYWMMIFLTYRAFRQVEWFENIIKNQPPKAIVCFSPATTFEEMVLTQVAKKYEIPTFAMQHGPFNDLSEEVFVPLITCENMQSDYILVWGKSSADVIGSYIDADQIILAGNPKYIYKKNINQHSNKLINGTLFLDETSKRQNSLQSNINLIKITKKFIDNNKEISIQVKIHPLDKLDNYKGLLNHERITVVDKGLSVKKLLDCSDFILVHNTAVASEALFYGIPVLRYKDSGYGQFWRDFDTFSGPQELTKLLSAMQENGNYNKLMKEYNKVLMNFFYFEKDTKVSKIYYNKINQAIERYYEKRLHSKK